MRYALRSLARQPGLLAAVTLTLALGMGATTAIFGVLNSLVLRPLQVADPERLVRLETTPGRDVFTYATWDQIRQRAVMFDGVFAWQGAGRRAVSQGNLTEQMACIYASGEFFRTLGIQPAIGRALGPQDDVLGQGAAQAMISYALWQRRFGGARNVIGTQLTIEKVPFTIVGVTPRGFLGLEVGQAFDVAVPLGAEPLLRGRESLINDALVTHWLRVVLRLRNGQSIEEATGAIRGLQPQIREASMPTYFPQARDQFLKEPLRLVPAGRGSSALRSEYTRPLLILFALVGLVLLVACVDIGHLLLARAAARRHEFAVQHALGASPSRVAAQVLAEGLLLAGLGAAAGLLVSTWASRVLVAQVTDSTALDLSLDWKVLGFVAAIAVASALLIATVPAFLAARVTPIETLKVSRLHGSRRGSGSALIAVQVALSLTLVVTAGLLVRTLAKLTSVPLGVDAERVLVTEIDVSRAAIEPGNRVPFYQRLTDELAALPGVDGAATSIATPLGGSPFFEVNVERQDAAAGRGVSKVNFVTPGWFGVFGVPLSAGRNFDRRDSLEAAPVVVVNNAFVRQFFPDRSAIGQTVRVAAGGGNLPMGMKTIVGVVGDTIGGSLRDGMPSMVYVPLAQWAFPIPVFPRVALSARTASGPPAALTPTIASTIVAADREIRPSAGVISDAVEGSLRQERLVARLSGSLAVLALLLAGIGHYGVASYAVKRRRPEIGVRIALGARPSEVVALVVGRSVLLSGIGIVAGLGCAALATRYLEGMLFGVTPLDPLTFAAVSLIFVVIAALATLLPARRAAKIDPLSALRAE